MNATDRLANRRGRWRIVGWVAAIAASLLVFAAYRQPDMVMQMALQVWSCF